MFTRACEKNTVPKREITRGKEIQVLLSSLVTVDGQLIKAFVNSFS